MKPALMAVLVVAVAACGGKAKPDSMATGQDGDKHAMDQKCEMGQNCEMGQMGQTGEMANMPPQVAKFHATLAPRWHAAQGPQRMTETCAAIAQFRTDADAIVAAPATSGANAASWAEGGKQLADAVSALDATCKAKDAAAFEPAFLRVHTSFHHVMEVAGAHAEPHGAHKM